MRLDEVDKWTYGCVRSLRFGLTVDVAGLYYLARDLYILDDLEFRCLIAVMEMRRQPDAPETCGDCLHRSGVFVTGGDLAEFHDQYVRGI